MKAFRKSGIWKAIAFFTAVISLVACQNDIPTVKTIDAAVNDGGTAIEVSGAIVSDGGEEVDWKGFCLSRHALPTISDKSQASHSTGASFTARFENLDQNATYYVRAYAMNSVGIGYGEVVEVYTSTLAFAQTGNAEVLSDTEATLKASVDALNSQVNIWFEVWTSGEALRKVEVPLAGAQSVTEVSAKAIGLTPGQVYSYTVKVQNTYGTASGETKTFQLPYEVVSDRDGNKYWTIKIGNQIWTVANLKTTRFLNGDQIANIQPDNEWIAMTTPAYCYYNNDPKLGEVYGALYNNYVGLDSRGLIAGYHVPTISEYETLVSYLGGGTTAARKLKSNTDDWYNGGKGDNSSGFNALPGGWRGIKETFSAVTFQSVFQTITKMEGLNAYYGVIIYDLDYMSVVTRGGGFQYYGRNIRLVKNN